MDEEVQALIQEFNEIVEALSDYERGLEDMDEEEAEAFVMTWMEENGQ